MRTCDYCGVEYVPVRRRAVLRFCSRKCKERERTASGKAAEANRRSFIKTRHGITREEVDEMSASGCAICGTTEWGGRFNRPHVDHDHRTGQRRGFLCDNCNNGLGRFKDDPARLRAAADYLER